MIKSEKRNTKARTSKYTHIFTDCRKVKEKEFQACVIIESFIEINDLSYLHIKSRTMNSFYLFHNMIHFIAI